MHIALFILLLLGLLFGPQLWVRYIFKRYSRERPDLSGTGGELAQHLIDRFALTGIRLGTTEQGDHYDPETRMVRLTPDVHDGRSLTAVAVAAHEVGHAIQHHQGESLFSTRNRLVMLAQTAQRGGAAALMVVPVVTALTRVPASGLLLFGLAMASLGSAAVVHLVTLPLEWDASFGKAMPILQRGKYLQEKDQRSVRRVLRAAAFTYLAASLASLLNVWRWWRVLRR
ncbi:zinc metallopeptidase [Thiohalomonas denitrificans]|uniref:zinc metallopeptidase n=1 Tax=Thiohalomonas denitrificans TaxID=415747 RepID=UPI0026EE2383|nr:zinc metallopeptidase [Thiohalomonas denitrificans]